MITVVINVPLIVSPGIETSCDARQSGTQCYGALNGTVVLHLTDIISGYELRFAGLIRNLVFVMKNQKVVYFNKKNEAKNDSRIYFETKTGTLRINKIWKEYSDNYTLQITNDSSGATSDRILQLSIEGK